MIALLESFHGRSYGSVSLTASKAKYRTGFGPLLPGVHHTPYGDFEHLEEVLFKRLVSPARGRGDRRRADPRRGRLRRSRRTGGSRYLRELCDRHGILLVADEVQSGMGRTGKMWAIEHFGVEPDIVLVGQGHRERHAARRDASPARTSWAGSVGAHGSTYGGNPVACAAALATFRLIEDGLMDNAARVGEVFLDGLRRSQARHPVHPRRARARA